MSGGRREALRVMVATFTFGAVALLLNADTVYHTATSQPLGWRRTVAVPAARLVQDVSSVLQLTEPRQSLEDALHRTSTPTTFAPAARPRTAVATTVVRARRTPTPDDPLRVLIVGDSLMFDAAPGIERRLAKLPQVRFETATWLGSGLSNPEFYDWPSKMAELVAEHRPEAVVVMFGGNDWRAREVDGRVLRPGTNAWRRFYERKVDEAVGILTAGGADLYWLGMPDVRPDDIQHAVPVLNEVYRSLERRWPAVTYVDGQAALRGPGGGFATYLRTEGGRLVEARKPDGIHFFDPGADRLADAVMRHLAADWDLQS